MFALILLPAVQREQHGAAAHGEHTQRDRNHPPLERAVIRLFGRKALGFGLLCKLSRQALRLRLRSRLFGALAFGF